MKALVATVALTVGLTSAAPSIEPAYQHARELQAAWRAHGLDPASPLESRIGPPSAELVKSLIDQAIAPTDHPLSARERQQITAAFAALPPLQRRVLQERLRRVSVVDGLPMTGTTMRVDGHPSSPLFDITIRASVLQETVSQFLTAKERTCFVASATTPLVFIEGGDLDAIVFVVIHEATHVVDFSLGLTPPVTNDGTPAAGATATPLTEGIWVDFRTLTPPYRNPLLDGIRFRGGRAMPMAQAEALYTALRRTPFVSLYGSSSWFEDLAELATWHHLTENLGQPYRITLREWGKATFAYEPMRSPRVRDRFPQLARFYE